MASRLIAVTPLSASAFAELRIDERREEADDRLTLAQPTDLRVGRLRHLEDDVGILVEGSVETIVAPASAYALSGIAAPAPAPVSTRISSPAACSLPSASGTRATRRSPGAVSLATPTFIGTT